eukprot:gene4015-20181_t
MSGSEYFNYKGYFSIVLLALASYDYKLIFVDIIRNINNEDSSKNEEKEVREFLSDSYKPDCDSDDEPVPVYNAENREQACLKDCDECHIRQRKIVKLQKQLYYAKKRKYDLQELLDLRSGSLPKDQSLEQQSSDENEDTMLARKRTFSELSVGCDDDNEDDDNEEDEFNENDTDWTSLEEEEFSSDEETDMSKENSQNTHFTAKDFERCLTTDQLGGFERKFSRTLRQDEHGINAFPTIYPQQRKQEDLYGPSSSSSPAKATKPGRGSAHRQLIRDVLREDVSLPAVSENDDQSVPEENEQETFLTENELVKIEIVNSTTATAVIPKLDRIFATHGIPVKLKTDNGPPLNGNEFKRYTKALGMEWKPSAPLWPQGNSNVESLMKPIGKVTDSKIRRKELETRTPKIPTNILNNAACNNESTSM